MKPDRAAMEASLAALGDRDEGLAAELFDRFIAAHPQHAPAFMNPAAAQERMVRETLEALLGLATDEWWVSTTIADFVALHANYGQFTAGDYAAWFDLVVTAMVRRAASDWPDEATAAWQRQAARLAKLVAAELAGDRTHVA